MSHRRCGIVGRTISSGGETKNFAADFSQMNADQELAPNERETRESIY
jgi:hypothetical protein